MTTKPQKEDLNKEEFEKIQYVFKLFDADGSNTINTAELEKMFSALGKDIEKGKIAQFLKDFDEDKNGVLSFDEFVNAYKWSRKHDMGSTELIEAFKLFDEDNSGYLDMKELKKVLSRDTSDGKGFKDEEIEEIFRDADLNGDGKISIDEFVGLINSKKD